MSAPLILKLKEQLEKLTPQILWEGETGDVTTITLQDDISNYKRIKVFYGDNNSQYLSSEVYNNGKSNVSIPLFTVFNQNTYHLLKFKSISIEGTKIFNSGIFTFDFANKTINYNNEIIVLRIEGYKN